MTQESAPPGRERGLLKLPSQIGLRGGWLAVLVIGSLLSGLTESGILAILAQVAAALVNGSGTIHLSLGPLTVNESVGTLLVIGLVLAVIRLFLQIPVLVLPVWIAADLQAELRRELFEAYTRASWAVQSRDREGHLQEILTNQVVEATAAVFYATALITALLSFLVLIVSAFALNFAAALVVLAASVGLFVLLRPLSTVARTLSDQLSLSYLDYAGAVSESARVAEDTQVFGVGGAQRRQVGAYIARSRHLFFRAQALVRGVPGVYQSLIYLVVVGGLALLHASNAHHVGSIGAVVLLLVRAGTYGQQAQGAHQGCLYAQPFVDRLYETRRRYNASSPRFGNRSLAHIERLELENASYAYEPGRPVLANLSFDVDANEAIGIVGPSGAGKSTLVQILLGLRLPDDGRYLANGIAAQEFDRVDWHRRVAFVPQDPRLLHASVADNIRYFRDFDDDEVERAARLAAIHDDVLSWPQGYNTIVGPRADAVSGGQQQRICLARALISRPEVLVLDEPTSALDPRSEALIQNSLVRLRDELTLFLVAHRMSTLDICERVLVIVDGRLEAFGTATELRATSAYYQAATELAFGSRSPDALDG